MKPVRVFETEWFSIEAIAFKVPDKPYYRLACLDAVEVVAMTSEGKIVLVRQFRPAVGISMLELPSGNVDKRESSRQAAARELLEETGYACSSLIPMGPFNDSPSRISNKVDVFFGKGAALAGRKKDKNIEVALASPVELDRMIARHEFTTVSGIGFYYLAKIKGFI